MVRTLRREGHIVSRCRVRRLMELMGLQAIYRKPRTSDPHPGHKVYPYLLRGLPVTRANQVWCTDITWIPMSKGFLYLMAVMDWHSRKILSWRLSNTMDTAFCLEVLEEALARHGRPDIFNSDQGSQFTSLEFTQALIESGIRISMDGRGCWRDNVFIERFWRSLKYECVYLNAFETGGQAREGIGRWISFYNQRRPHSTHGISTPDEVFERSISNWKKQAMEALPEVFSGKISCSDKDRDKEISTLHEKIGQLTVERDFLVRVSGRKQARAGDERWWTVLVGA